MKLSQYAAQHDIKYRAAWNRYKAGKIPGAYQDSSGTIHVPERSDSLKHKCAIYARVSTAGQKDDLLRQADRLKEFAISRGYEIVWVATEVGSGVNDHRKDLTSLLTTHKDEWGTLIVEHRDRLTRAGFGWFPTLLSMSNKELIVVDPSTDNEDGRLDDILSLMYAYAASEYGKRGAKARAKRARESMGDLDA